MINETLLNEFFKAAKQEAFAVLSTLFLSPKVDEKETLLGQNLYFEHDSAKSFTDGEVISLIKVFAREEGVLSRWKAIHNRCWM